MEFCHVDKYQSKKHFELTHIIFSVLYIDKFVRKFGFIISTKTTTTLASHIFDLPEFISWDGLRNEFANDIQFDLNQQRK